ncbi:hypothetical protein HDU87_005511 [Geranomyces variabilis]|uniref:Uncharacterized protein n=1 Tax=Geranomyces variabilis TaxID=109894 RepID=A0AAD5TM89_9FUNG|nr:hypothetical protein HDU87_005511 [Geranomyces variabilis]
MRFATLALAATALAASASAQSGFTCEFWGENEDMEISACDDAAMPFPHIASQEQANGIFATLASCKCKSITTDQFRWQVAHCAEGADIARNQGEINACDAGDVGRFSTLLKTKITQNGVDWVWKDVGGGNAPPPPPPVPVITTTAGSTPTVPPIHTVTAIASVTQSTGTTPTPSPIGDCFKTVVVTVDGAKTITPTPRAEDATCSITYQTTTIKVGPAPPAYTTPAPIADCFKTVQVTVEQHATATTTITPSPHAEDATCSITYKTTTVVGDDCTTTTTAAPAGPTAKPEYEPEYSGAGRLVVGGVAAVAGAFALLI